MSDFKKEIIFRPAWDRRSEDPNKNYGIHGAEMVFYLRGPKGTIQFMCSTGWFLPQNRGSEFIREYFNGRPRGTDVGYHSPVPMYEGQSLMSGECEYVEGGKCYYDGSGLRAEEWIEELISGGSERIWHLMEEEYRMRFDNPGEVTFKNACMGELINALKGGV